MKVPVYNQEGKEVGSALLPKEIFEVKLNQDLVYQVAVSQMANRRQVLANTKGRGEVSGGGKKPWRQKGTGRARVGSIRSPLWRGGGITFGPTKERNFKKKINKKMKKTALFMILSAKAKDNNLTVLEELKIEKAKTKIMAGIFKNLPGSGKNILLVLPKLEKDVILASRNLPGIRTVEARNLNSLDLLSFKRLIMPKETIRVIKETFASKR